MTLWPASNTIATSFHVVIRICSGNISRSGRASMNDLDPPQSAESDGRTIARDLSVPTVEPITPKMRASRYEAERIFPLSVDVVAELGRTKCSLSRLHALTPGDTLAFGPQKPVILKVNGRPVIACEAGTRGGSRSVKMLHRITTGEDG